MRYIITLLTCLFILLPHVVLSETINELVSRDGLYYKKLSDVPFTGKTNGSEQCQFKNGKKQGLYVSYHRNGQLFQKGHYKNGKQHGEWIAYYESGKLWTKTYSKHGIILNVTEWWEKGNLHYKGAYKNGKKEGPWVYYSRDGEKGFANNIDDGMEAPVILNEGSGTYKDGKKISN